MKEGNARLRSEMRGLVAGRFEICPEQGFAIPLFNIQRQTFNWDALGVSLQSGIQSGRKLSVVDDAEYLRAVDDDHIFPVAQL